MISFSRAVERYRNGEDGAVLVLVAMSLVLLCLCVALTADLGLVRLTATRLQYTASSAALAAAQELPDQNNVNRVALEYTEKNYTAPGGNSVVVEADILIGTWTGEEFIAGGEPINAVEVTARRQDANSNPITSIFARLGGIEKFQVERSAVATAGAGGTRNCESGGFFSDKWVESGSNNNYLPDFCLYGRDYVKIGSNNNADNGAWIGMVDQDDFVQSQDNELGDNPWSTEEPLDLPIAESVDERLDRINSIKDSPTDQIPDEYLLDYPLDEAESQHPWAKELGLPERVQRWEEVDFISNGKVEDKDPLDPNTLYFVKEVADFGSDNNNVKNVAVVAKKEIKVGSNSEVANAFFITPDKILFGSNLTVGGSDPCAGGDYNTFLYSKSNIEFNSNNIIQATEMGAQEELLLGSNNFTFTQVRGEALGFIDYGSTENYGTCPLGPLTSPNEEIRIITGDLFLRLVH